MSYDHVLRKFLALYVFYFNVLSASLYIFNSLYLKYCSRRKAGGNNENVDPTSSNPGFYVGQARVQGSSVLEVQGGAKAPGSS